MNLKPRKPELSWFLVTMLVTMLLGRGKNTLDPFDNFFGTRAL